MIDGWVDAHCHILPQIDDGAADINESLEMARIAAKDGIQAIIATPHLTETDCSPDEIKKRVGILNQALSNREIPVTVYPAAEVSIALDPSVFDQYTINDSRYVLIELPCEHLPPFTEKLMSWLSSEGLKPIIAHPERNHGIMREPQSFIKRLNSNIYIQITAGSLIGDFGVDAQLCAEILMDAGRVDIIASDGHSMKDRPPILSEAVEMVAKRVGRETALKMVQDNPAAVLRDEVLDVRGKRRG